MKVDLYKKLGSLTNPVIEVSPKLKIYFPYRSKKFQLRPDHGICQRTKNYNPMNFLKITFSLFLFIFFSKTDTLAQVKAFGEADFQGTEVVLKEGKYFHTQLQKRGLKNLGSLRVPKGCSVKVYGGDNLQGAVKRYSKNDANITDESTNYSLKVLCGSVGAQPGFAIGASDEVGRKGDLIFVDVNVSDFNRIVSMQYSMNWDPKVLQFEKVTNFNLKDLGGENFGLKQVAKGNLLLAWYDTSVQGVNLPSGTNIYQVVFRVIGADASKSKIKFSGNPLATEIMRADGTPIYFNNLNGSFTLK